MKKLMLIFVLSAFGMFTINAQEVNSFFQQVAYFQQDTKIELKDLPDEIKKNIDENLEDRAAKIQKIHKKSEDGKTVYELTFQKDDMSRYMKKYDEDGEVLERKEVKGSDTLYT